MENERLLRLVSRSQPHQVLAYLIRHTGPTPSKIDKTYGGTELGTLCGAVKSLYKRKPELSDDPIRNWFEPLQENLDRKFGDLVENDRVRRDYAQLLNSVVGKTAFQDYYLRNRREVAITEWCETTEDLLQIAEWEKDDHEAFEKLYVRHAGVLNGYIRGSPPRPNIASLIVQPML